MIVGLSAISSVSVAVGIERLRILGGLVGKLAIERTNVIEVPVLGKDAVEGLYAAALFEIRTKIPPKAR